ncbi:MAG TPA: substrate-binding domain-containing protein [Acidimicrobiales bacterium]
MAGVILASGMVLLMAFVPVGAGATTPSKDTVDVIFDSSLTDTMAALAAPFHKATGLSMLQTSGESRVDAKAIAGKTATEDVFVSEGAASEQSLEGQKNGNWVSWYAQFGSTPLLLAYNPKSKFAKDLKTMAWYKVVTMKGFLLGRATPDTDSSGSLAITALKDAAKSEHLSVLSKLAVSKTDVYSETDLLTGLQKGQLDAAFFYGVDTTADGLRTVPLGSLHLAAPYMVTILRGAAHEGAAVNFVKFLLRPSTASITEKGGVIEKLPSLLNGKPTAVPLPLRSTIS